MELRRKCVIVGDVAVGKTCMISSYLTGSFPGEYIPTVFPNYAAFIYVDGASVLFSFWDTACQHDYARLRPISYPSTDVFLMCFSVDSRSSLENISEKWVAEVRHYCPETAIILVGTKIDLREDEETLSLLKANNTCPITFEEGEATRKQHGMTRYVECSAISQQGLARVFEEAARASLSPTPVLQISITKKKRCCIL